MSEAIPSAVIHQLRTLLGQIVGYSELLADQAEEREHLASLPDLRKVTAASYLLQTLIERHFLVAPETANGTAALGNGHVDASPSTPAAASQSAQAASGLADFIHSNREPILAEWDAFARTCTPASGSMDFEALRDHASEILATIADDLRRPQGAQAQLAKSHGQAPAGDAQDPPTAAEAHGSGRAASGFSAEQMISEYRALRASVIRLWTRSQGTLEAGQIEDLTRFNEAIDQSLAESISCFSEEMRQSKEMFLAILAHDLRAPLAAVVTSAEFMLETQELAEPSRSLTSQNSASARRMLRMVGDLLDLTRSRLGGGIPVVRAPMSMTTAVEQVAAELGAGHPAHTLRVIAEGAQPGEWDADRIGQALTNLIGNALQHGAPGGEVRVELAGDEQTLALAIRNQGTPIPADQLDGIFRPMKVKAGDARGDGLGLGLYIAERIVTAHRGRISMESGREDGTVVRIELPRKG
jgi:signal transduction histidine kinase